MGGLCRPGRPVTERLLREEEVAEPAGDAAKEFLEGRVSEWRPGETLSALGLDSLDLAEMRAAAAELGAGLPPPGLFADPEITLGDLADRLRDHLGVSKAKTPPEETLPPVPPPPELSRVGTSDAVE